MIKKWTFWQQFNRLFTVVVLLTVVGIICKDDRWHLWGRILWFGSFALYPKVPDSIALYQRDRFQIYIRYASIIMLLISCYALWK
ncbi:hypothetical protein ACVV62_03285 [Streptococcus pluranimalium]